MKSNTILCLLAAVMAVSCHKDPAVTPVDPIKYGVDGKTPLPEAVDLGLTVNGRSVKWASFNLGAAKEYEFGNFFAWGETEKKDVYDWTTYAYGYYGFSGPLVSRYCMKEDSRYWDYDAAPEGPDNIGVLLLSDDAAQVNLGGNWRIPTDEEWDALYKTKSDKENYSWTKENATDANGTPLLDAEGQPVSGWRITSKKAGTEGNSIFLPAAGEFSGKDRREGVEGSYWSSGLYHDASANCFYFSGEVVLSPFNCSATRCLGYSIRPVYCR